MRIDRVVIDTNVFVSAAISALGKPALVIDWCVQRRVLATSRPMLDEVRLVLQRPRFARVIEASARDALLELLASRSLVVEVLAGVKVCRDEKDDIVLATALAANATVIVTGDEDLLILDPFEGVRILTPADFLALVTPDQP